jgi:excisionase family DNA binding protein
MAVSAQGVALAEPWVSVEEVAKHLGVTKDSVYRWIDHRDLPAHKIGRLWKFKLSEVDNWVVAAGAESRGVADDEGDGI